METMKEHSKHLPVGRYKLMIVIAALTWGLAFVLMKDVLGIIPQAYVLGIRFFLTGILLALFFMKRMRKAFDRVHLVYGGVLGLMMFVAFWVQTTGLTLTTPGKNAFLTATYVIAIPFIYWVIEHKRPTAYHLFAALFCVVGMGFVSLQSSFTAELGDAISVAGAIFFGIHIVFVSRWAQKCDVIVLTVYQFLVAGLMGLVIGFLFETPPSVEIFLDPYVFAIMVYLIVVASCLALVLQNVALAHVHPAQASLFLSLEAVFGVLFSVLLYGEVLTARLLTGFTFIFLAIVISETFPLKEAPWCKKKATMQRAVQVQKAQTQDQKKQVPEEVVQASLSEKEELPSVKPQKEADHIVR